MEGPQPGSQATRAFRKAQQQSRERSSQIGIPSLPGALPLSGVHPDASGQVLCPFCNKTYLFSDALLNRKLRCSGCRAIFRVAEDRRSFRVQAATGAPSAEAGMTSKAAHSALREANLNLNRAAAEAMRALSRQERPAPPGSGTALLAAVKAPAEPSTRTIRRKSSGATLTGEGERDARHRTRLGLGVAGIIVVVLLGVWLAQPDGRSRTLGAFQQRMSFDYLEQARRDRVFSGGLDPIVDIADARFAAVVQVDLGGLATAVEGMRILARGAMWVDQADHGEASALLGDEVIDSPAAAQRFAARCKKAGITVVEWSRVVEAGETGQPPEAKGVVRAMLRQLIPAGDGFDPLQLIDSGRLPRSIAVSSFSGTRGARLVPGKPALRPVHFHGRLVRFRGPGWPDAWMVFDLHAGDPVR